MGPTSGGGRWSAATDGAAGVANGRGGGGGTGARDGADCGRGLVVRRHELQGGRRERRSAPPPRQGHVRSFRFPPAPATVTTHTQTDRQTYGMNEVSRPQPKRSTRVHGPTEAQDRSPRCRAVHERHAHDTTPARMATQQARIKPPQQHSGRASGACMRLPGPSIQRHSSRCSLHRPSPCSHSVARGGAERLPQQAKHQQAR